MNRPRRRIPKATSNIAEMATRWANAHDNSGRWEVNVIYSRPQKPVAPCVALRGGVDCRAGPSGVRTADRRRVALVLPFLLVRSRVEAGEGFSFFCVRVCASRVPFSLHRLHGSQSNTTTPRGADGRPSPRQPAATIGRLAKSPRLRSALPIGQERATAARHWLRVAVAPC